MGWHFRYDEKEILFTWFDGFITKIDLITVDTESKKEHEVDQKNTVALANCTEKREKKRERVS